MAGQMDIVDRDRRRVRAVAAAGALIFLVVAFAGCAGSSKRTEQGGAEEAAGDLPEPSEQSQENEGADSSAGTEGSSESEPSGDKTGDTEQKKEVSGSTKKKIETAVDISEDGNEERAERILKRFVDDSEAGFLAAYNLAVIAEKRGDVSGAANYYTDALDKNPDFTPALVNLVRLYVRKGRVRDADELARNYIDARPDNLDHRAARLEVMLAREQYRDVIRKAKKLLREDERNVEAMLAMARANYKMERPELTKAILNRAAELSPDRSEIYFLFGLVAVDNEDRGRAISNFEKTLELNPRYAEAHNNLGLLYHEAGDYEAAASQFREAIADYPDFKKAKLNLGNALKQLGKKKGAEEKFKEVMSMDSSYADAYFNLGVLYLDSSLPNLEKIPRLEKAIEYLNEYKQKAAGQLAENDPTNDYIKSAREKIKAEKERQKMMRKSQQSAGSGGGSEQSSGGGDGSEESSQ